MNTKQNIEYLGTVWLVLMQTLQVHKKIYTDIKYIEFDNINSYNPDCYLIETKNAEKILSKIEFTEFSAIHFTFAGNNWWLNCKDEYSNLFQMHEFPKKPHLNIDSDHIINYFKSLDN